MWPDPLAGRASLRAELVEIAEQSITTAGRDALAAYDRDLAERRAEHRATLERMSDQAVAYQLANGARGGIQREEIERAARRRGLLT